MYRRWVADKKRIPLDEFVNVAVNLVCNGVLSMPEYLNSSFKEYV